MTTVHHAGLSGKPCGYCDVRRVDEEALAEAIFRVGTGYRQRETATIAARIANSQDGAHAAGEFAAAVAAEYGIVVRAWLP